jgi:RNA recognition motif-containing protein
MNNRLYVENLGPGITDQSLRELFSQKGQVLEIQMVLDPSTGKSNGRAYITMATPELAVAALAFHSHSLEGRNIAVTQARPIEARPAGMIGQGFDVYQSPDQQRAAQRNAGQGQGQNRKGRHGRRRFAPSK